MNLQALEEEAKAVSKSLGDNAGKKVIVADDQLTIANKALDLIKSILPAALRKATFGGEETEEEEAEEQEEMMKKKLGKSGETRQPHGDQNHLNTGEMSSERKIPKKFNYDEKMDDTDVDYPENAKTPYYDEKRKVHKSFADIQNDPDLSDEDRVYVVNDWLEKGFAQTGELRQQVAHLQKAIDIMAYAQTAILKSIRAGLEHQANTGRGRASAISLVDKNLAQKSATTEQANGVGDLNRYEISQRLLKAQSAGKLNFNQVSEAEVYLNSGAPLPAPLVRVITEAGNL
jgi:hypothetical protein